jgi:hypothetical protein
VSSGEHSCGATYLAAWDIDIKTFHAAPSDLFADFIGDSGVITLFFLKTLVRGLRGGVYG